MKTRKTLLIISIGLFLFLLSPFYQSLYSQGKNTYVILKGKMQVLNQIIAYINEFHFEKVNTVTLMDGAFDGIMKKLDPHSVYIPPKELGEIDEKFKGDGSSEEKAARNLIDELAGVALFDTRIEQTNAKLTNLSLGPWAQPSAAASLPSTRPPKRQRPWSWAHVPRTKI